VSTLEGPGEEYRLRLFSVDDPRLWLPRSQLNDAEFADVADEEWDEFHRILSEG
jgi:hypothetical protein